MSDDGPPQTDGDDEEEEPVTDPFAELGEGIDGSANEEREGVDASADADPFSDDADPDDPFFDDEDPDDTLSDADPFDQLGPATGADSAGDLDDAFEEMDVSGPATEDVWDSLDEDLSDTGAAAGAAGTGESPAAQGAADPSEHGVEHIVNKRTYCQQCPHFSPPPDVACDHDGTTIVEAVGFDEFRVRNCPMVSEDDPTFDTDG